MPQISLQMKGQRPTVAAGANAPKQADSQVWQQIWRARTLYLLLLPIIIGTVLFNYYPTLVAFYRSFFSWDGHIAHYIGLVNFKLVFTDPAAVSAWINIVKFLIANLIKTLTVPLIVAYLIYRLNNTRHAYVYRVLFVFPIVVPSFVFIVFWRWVFSYYGLINWMLRAIGLEEWTHTWLTESSTAFGSLVFVGFPWVAAVTMLIFLAGFLNVPSEIVDAAIVDGATGFKRLWHVELPGIRDQVKMFILLTIIGTLQDFTLPFWLTGGGPGYTTTVPALNMWQAAFGVGMGERGGRGYSYGYASAIGVVLFIAILALTLIGRRYLYETEDEVASSVM